MLKSVLVTGAHPDDETILAGGTIALLAHQGCQVHILCATRGEGGEVGEPPVCDRPELGRVREAELRCAASRLGVASVQILSYVDPTVGPDEELYPFEADMGILSGQIRQAIRTADAEVVLTHGSDGEYGHPAHRLMHAATRLAVQASSKQPLLYSFAAQVQGIEDRIWNQNDSAHLALDIRPWLEIKATAAECHITQMALFKRRLQVENVRDALRTVESFHRHIPALDGGSPQDAFADILIAAGAWLPGLS